MHFYMACFLFTQMFKGNSGADSVKFNVFEVPIIAQWVRINPTRWRDRISLRAELYGCEYSMQQLIHHLFFPVDFVVAFCMFMIFLHSIFSVQFPMYCISTDRVWHVWICYVIQSLLHTNRYVSASKRPIQMALFYIHVAHKATILHYS